MRIVSWNCGSGFHRKIAALSALAPDVAIVQECADLDTLARKARQFTPTTAIWTGDNPHKGLGVFSFGPYRLVRGGIDDASITYALRACVVGPLAFNLVALWSHYGKSPVTAAAPGPTLLALRAYARFLTERPAVIAGDLNNHVRWDKPGKASNHANAVAASAALGLRRRRFLCKMDCHGPQRSCAVDRRLLSRIRCSRIGRDLVKGASMDVPRLVSLQRDKRSASGCLNNRIPSFVRSMRLNRDPAACVCNSSRNRASLADGFTGLVS